MPQIIAHRGYSAKYPENTRMAFAEALKAGAQGLECDVQKTQDGQYVILHDETLDRTSNGKGRVDEHTLEELKKLDFGKGESILTLEELITLTPADCWLNVEVKSGTLKHDDLTQIIFRLTNLRGTQKTLISSFEHSWLPQFRRAGFQIGMLLGEEHQSLSPLALMLRVIKIAPTYMNLPIQAFERLPENKVKMLIRIFKVLGPKIVFWTVNQEDQWNKIHGYSSFVITDEVEKMKKLAN